jgi:hypothetical protein
LLVLLFDQGFLGLPFNAKWGIGQHIVERLARVAIGALAVTKGVTEDNVINRLVLDQHIGTANRVGLRVIVLAIQCEMGLRIVLADARATTVKRTSENGGPI